MIDEPVEPDHSEHGGNLCEDADGDGVCDHCHASLDACGECGGVGYHREGCDLIDGG